MSYLVVKFAAVRGLWPTGLPLHLLTGRLEYSQFFNFAMFWSWLGPPLRPNLHAADAVQYR